MNDQLKMDDGKSGGAVECLGLTFPSDDARRERFLQLLADKLKDPTVRAQEGFPIGTDAAILAMSFSFFLPERPWSSRPLGPTE